MEILLSDLGLVESPRWHGERLWFADWIAGRIIAFAPSGEPTVVLEHASLPLCFDFLPDGRMLVVSNQERALLQRAAGDPSAVLTPYADLSGLSEFGAGNDIVVDGRGRAYVNNPNYDAMGGPPPSGDVAPGFVALVPPDGTARIVARDLAFPNGMAVTPDGRTLIVAESHRQRLTAFDIEADGELSGRRVWADLGEDAPDGICCDSEGAVWYADVPHQHCVRVFEGGRVADTVSLDRGGFACMLGGPDRSTLFVVAAQWPGMAGIAEGRPWHGQVLSTPVAVPGAGWPGPH